MNVDSLVIPVEGCPEKIVSEADCHVVRFGKSTMLIATSGGYSDD